VFLKALRLYNFKNYREVDFIPDPKLNCFLGKNGSGKTNLLDAIHYLAFTKSAINPVDAQNIRSGERQFMIKGFFSVAGKEKEVMCSFQSGLKKVVKEDNQDYVKFSNHVGKYPVVLITPQDIELIWGGGELRRKFFDTLLSQIDADYLENLISYSHHLKQRNGALRRFAETGNTDYQLLESYDVIIAKTGTYIHSRRTELMKEFTPLFKLHYSLIAPESAELVDIQYRSELNKQPLLNLLKNSIHRDILLQRTSVGVHRDEFSFVMDGNELNKVGSQGQQKSFLISLKLCEFEVIAKEKDIKPILLLDDIFDKLDDVRIRHLMKLVAEGRFGQIFITDAREDRSMQILHESNLAAKVFFVENGNLKTNGENSGR
jgi:DNA replication and repair protein RecF